MFHSSWRRGWAWAWRGLWLSLKVRAHEMTTVSDLSIRPMTSWWSSVVRDGPNFRILIVDTPIGIRYTILAQELQPSVRFIKVAFSMLLGAPFGHENSCPIC